jgi:hypothetical protein
MDVDGAVPVLEVDPDLGAALHGDDRLEAARVAMAVGAHLRKGPWSPPRHAEHEHMGLLVLDGVLTRVVEVSGRRSVELLAAGDVLRPWVELGDDAPATVTIEWAVMDPVTVAVLDGAFARRVARWP